MATGGQFYWPSVGTFVAAYGQFFMAANILMYIPSGDVITSASRDAVILLTEARSTKKTLQRFGFMILVFFAALCAFIIWLFSLTILDDAIEPWIGLLVPLWFVVGLLLLVASTGGSLSALKHALTLVRPRGPYWVAQALASAPEARTSGLEFARTAIEAFVPAGVPVVVTAASEKIAVVYERYGFVRQGPGSLNLLGNYPLVDCDAAGVHPVQLTRPQCPWHCGHCGRSLAAFYTFYAAAPVIFTGSSPSAGARVAILMPVVVVSQPLADRR